MIFFARLLRAALRACALHKKVLGEWLPQRECLCIPIVASILSPTFCCCPMSPGGPASTTPAGPSTSCPERTNSDQKNRLDQINRLDQKNGIDQTNLDQTNRLHRYLPRAEAACSRIWPCECKQSGIHVGGTVPFVKNVTQRNTHIPPQLPSFVSKWTVSWSIILPT